MKNIKDFIKQTTSIPNDFIDDMFGFYDNETLQTDFVIILDYVAKWLNSRKDTLVETLHRSYKEHIDYTVQTKGIRKTTPKSNNQKLYLLTPDCFKRLAMMSKSKNAELVRSYFIEVEGLYIKYRKYIMNGMEQEIRTLQNNQKPKTYKGRKGGFIYIIKVADREDVFKVGRTEDIAKRMKTYQTGLADDVDVLFMYETDDVKKTEKCVHAWLSDHQYRENKEVYQIDVSTLKDVISGCQRVGAKLKHVKQKGSLEGQYLVLMQEKN